MCMRLGAGEMVFFCAYFVLLLEYGGMGIVRIWRSLCQYMGNF